MLGHGSRRAARALERVAVSAHDLGGDVVGRGFGPEERAERSVDRGVGAPRLGRALSSRDLGRTRAESTRVDELAGDSVAGAGALGCSCWAMAGSMARGADVSGNCLLGRLRFGAFGP